MTPEAITITLQVIEALEELNIDYLIGGSFASTLHGMPRATMDADLVADLRFEHIPSFVELLQEDFYMHAEVIRDAIKNRSSFNLIHLLSAFKIDIFILGKRPFDLSEFSRRKLEQILSELPRSAYVKTPEDAVLSKLEWFKMGGKLSELQWRDIQGILKVQGPKIDISYLKKWAKELGLSDLLEQALTESL